MPKIKLTHRELEVMHVLWSTDRALSAADIPPINPELKPNTVQAVLKKLLENSYIQVADIVYHRTVLTRTYRPVLTHEDYMHSQIEGTSLTPGRLLADLIRKEQDIDALDELLRLIQEQRKSLRKR